MINRFSTTIPYYIIEFLKDELNKLHFICVKVGITAQIPFWKKTLFTCNECNVRFILNTEISEESVFNYQCDVYFSFCLHILAGFIYSSKLKNVKFAENDRYLLSINQFSYLVITTKIMSTDLTFLTYFNVIFDIPTYFTKVSKTLTTFRLKIEFWKYLVFLSLIISPIKFLIFKEKFTFISIKFNVINDNTHTLN